MAIARKSEPPEGSKPWVEGHEPPKRRACPWLGSPSRAWPIRDSTGRLFGIQVRFENGGSKDVRWYRDEWGPQGDKVKEAPLYLSEESATWAEDQAVLVVEGEKSADSAKAIHPQLVGISEVVGVSVENGPGMAEYRRGLRSELICVWNPDDALAEHTFGSRQPFVRMPLVV